MDLNWVMQTVTMIGIGAIGYFLKTTVSELKEQIKDNSKKVDEVEDKVGKKIGELEKELDDLKSDLPFIYVTREDFIRSLNNVDSKLDKIYDSMIKGVK